MLQARLRGWSGAGWPAVDYLRPRGRPSVLQRAGWIAAALALGVGVADAWEAWQARSAARLALERARSIAAAASVPIAPLVPAAAAPALPPGLSAALSALDHPWPAVFALLEVPAPEGVRWLGFSHAAGQGLELKGRASTEPAAWLAATRLRERGPAIEGLDRAALDIAGLGLTGLERDGSGLRMRLVVRGEAAP